MTSYNQDPYRPLGEQQQEPVPPTTGGVPSTNPSVAATPLEPAGTTSTGGGARDAADSLAGPAGDVKETAKSSGKQVLGTAKAEAGQVVDEAKTQGRRLLDESVSELRSQASTAQSRLADTLQALTDELGAMASSPDANGPMAQLAGSGRELGDRATSWLRDNDLDQALAGVRRYAARNPWTFLAIAGGAGLLVGRLARGLRDANQPDDSYGYYGDYRRGDVGGYTGTPSSARRGAYLQGDPTLGQGSSNLHYGDPDVGYGDADVSYGSTERGYGSAEGGYGSTQRGYGSAERPYGEAERAYGDADPDPLADRRGQVGDSDLYRDAPDRGQA